MNTIKSCLSLSLMLILPASAATVTVTNIFPIGTYPDNTNLGTSVTVSTTIDDVNGATGEAISITFNGIKSGVAANIFKGHSGAGKLLGIEGGANNLELDSGGAETIVISFSRDVVYRNHSAGFGGINKVVINGDTILSDSNVSDNTGATGYGTYGTSAVSGILLQAGDTIQYSNTGANGGLTAFEIVAVPEPSSAALLGLGGLALILRRRK